MRPDPNTTSLEAQVIIDSDINVVSRMLAETYPTTWKRTYTKSIDAPGNYYSSKSLATGLTSAIEESRIRSRLGEELDSNMGFVADRLEKHDFPTYYVSAPLIAALKHSKPPEGIRWSDITLPFPSLCFMLPRGSLVEPASTGGKDLILIGVCRFNAGEPMRIPSVCHIDPLKEDRISTFWMLAPSALITNDTTFPTSHPLEPLTEWIDEVTANRPYFGPATSFSVHVAGLVANLILLMESRKELIEPGKRIKKSTREGKVDLHSPTFIGRNYSILRKYPAGDPSGHFTELGWRAGHFKRQHYGPKNEQLKTVWIDPYIAFTRGLKATDEKKGKME